MQEGARAREFDVLLVDDLSRLTRDASEQSNLLKKFRFWGVRLIAVSDGLDTAHESGLLLGALKGAMNQQFLVDFGKRVRRGQRGQALQSRWNGGRPYGYRLKPVLDKAQRDQYGEPKRMGTVLVKDPVTSKISCEIITRFADGESCRISAADLNERGVPSPGSTWKRKTRRCKGWMDSAVRGIVMNPLYKGMLRSNTTKYLKDPESNKDRRRARPESEWVMRVAPELRVVSDELFTKAERRQKSLSNDDARLKSSNKTRH